MEVKHLLTQRYLQNKEIQKEYNSLKTYEEKLEFVYNILKQTQEKTLDFKQNDYFVKNSIEDLEESLKKVPNLDDFSFLNFVNDKVIKPINTDIAHVRLDIKTSNIAKDELNDSNEKTSENIVKKETTQSENVENKENNITYKKADDKTLVIKIKSFKKKYLEDDQKTIEEIKNLEKTEDLSNVIFDIRGNDGGTDEYSTLFSAFANKDVIEESRFKNTISGDIDSLKNTIVKKGTDKEYNRYLLVDKDCYSTADAFARNFKNTNFATLIGETTKGEGFGFTPFKCELASFGNAIKGDKKLENVTIYFPIECPVNEKGKEDFSEFYTKPNIKCNPEDALKVALNHIKNRTKEMDENVMQM